MTSPSITPSLINKCDHQAFINKCDHRAFINKCDHRAFKNKCDLTGPWLITPRYAVIGARGDAHHDPRVVAGLWEGGGGGLIIPTHTPGGPASLLSSTPVVLHPC